MIVIDKTKMVAGANRNFEIFDPLDFLAAVTSHIPIATSICCDTTATPSACSEAVAGLAHGVARTTTSKGLKVRCRLDRRLYTIPSQDLRCSRKPRHVCCEVMISRFQWPRNRPGVLVYKPPLPCGRIRGRAKPSGPGLQLATLKAATSPALPSMVNGTTQSTNKCRYAMDHVIC